eukprot:GHVO01013737.1.p1 GENE.GHVO01013737.1~~GHVO01013737.1.p1  ORF type:complete len:216 (+),score=2.71 GHVO01013737.1:67-714(+)
MKQMDFDYSLLQMVYLLSGPKFVSQFVLYRKETKARWARDDPAFLVLLVGFILLTGFAYGLSVGVFSFGRLVMAALSPVLLFFAGGILVAGTCYWVVRKTCNVPGNSWDSFALEFAYCFDIHSNSTLPLFIVGYAVPLLLLPVLTYKYYIAVAFANIIWASALTCYCATTVLGYAALPFVKSGEMFAYPILVVWLLAVILTSVKVNALLLFLPTI